MNDLPANWDKLKAEVFKRDKHKCQECDATENLTAHHKKPRSKGGSNMLFNLITLCASCHDKIELELDEVENKTEPITHIKPRDMRLIIPNKSPPKELDLHEQTGERTIATEIGSMSLCKNCGRIFMPYRSFQRYCSDRCRTIAASGKPSTYIKKKIKRHSCKECSKEFETNDDKRRYCSPTCYQSYQLKRHVPSEERTCLQCGKKFTTTHWLKRYCSEECRRQAHKNH